MSLGEKCTQDQMQKNQINYVEAQPNIKLEESQIRNSGMNDANLSKQLTLNQLSDLKYQPFHLDESWITNRYDLEQLNYRVFMNKEYERSFRLQERLLEMDDKNPEYYHQHSLTYLALNDIDNAQKWYNKAIQNCPYFDSYFFDYGKIFSYSQELIDQLPESFIDSIKYIQNNIDSYKEQENQLISECLFAYNVFLSQRPQKALKMLKLLTERYPKSYLLYFYTSKCYYHTKDYSQSLEYINLAIMSFRYKNIQLYNLKGQILIQTGDYTEAVRVYQQFPNNEYFKEKLGRIFFLLKDDLNQRIRMEAIRQDFIIQRAYVEKGIYNYQLGQYEVSRDCFLNSIKQNPFSGLSQFMLAKCYFKLGDFTNAQIHSNIALSHYDDAQRIKKFLNKIENEVKRSDEKTYITFIKRKFYFY